MKVALMIGGRVHTTIDLPDGLMSQPDCIFWNTSVYLNAGRPQDGSAALALDCATVYVQAFVFWASEAKS